MDYIINNNELVFWAEERDWIVLKSYNNNSILYISYLTPLGDVVNCTLTSKDVNIYKEAAL